MSSPPRVLCIYKKSAYQIYIHERKHPRVAALLRARHTSVDGLVRAHKTHERTLNEARRVLNQRGARPVSRRRSAPHANETSFDLVVTLGGDGTLLWASHGIGPDCPVL